MLDGTSAQLFVILFGLAWTVFGVHLLWWKWRFIRRAVVAKGMITQHFEPRAASEGIHGARMRVVFKTGEGRKVMFSEQLGFGRGRFPEYAEVEVLYDPSWPRQAHINHALRLWLFDLLVLAGGLATVATGVYWY